MNPNSIAIVFGYLPNIDKASKKAKALQLEERFSVALDTYYPEHDGDMFFNGQTCCTLLNLFLQNIEFEEIHLRTPDENMRVFTEIDQLLTFILTFANNEEDGCFHSITIFSKQQAICFIETTFYTALGGPGPYHDTYNFSIYQHSYNANCIQAALQENCSNHGIEIRDILHGNNRPATSLWHRIKRLF